MKHFSEQDARFLPRFPRASVIAVCGALAVFGCKKDDEKKEGEESADQEKTDEAKEAEGEADEGVGDAAAKAVGEAATIADALSPATDLQRGEVLGHVLLPNPSNFLEEIKTQAVPSSLSMFLDETMLRNMASGQLGSRSKVAENLLLDKPLGCAVIDSTATDVPVACVMGYTGGAKTLVTDLGSEGQQADAGGHMALYEVDGQRVYIDELGDMVVLSNHDEVLGKAKPYLEKNLVARASEVASDIETVVFLSAALQRYKEQLEPVMKGFGEMPLPAGSSPFESAMAEFSKTANDNNMQQWRDTEQITFGISLEERGAAMRWAQSVKEGSQYAEDMKKYAAGPLDMSFLQRLPAASFMVMGYRFDNQADETTTYADLRRSLVQAYADETGKDAAAIEAKVKEFVDDTTKTYGQDVAFGLMHLPDTPGALVVEAPLADGASGKDLWRKWSKELAPENVLTGESKEKLTWAYTPDAATLDGVAVDRWIFEPTEAGKKDMKGSDVEAFKKKVGKPQAVLDIAEAEGRAIFVLSLGDTDKVEKSTVAALAAAKGKGTVAEAPGYEQLAAHTKGVTTVMALDVQRGADWVRALIPPDEAAKIPSKLGNDLTDVYVVGAFGSDGRTNTGELIVSQRFIDNLRALAEK